jgi:hypothetical protein
VRRHPARLARRERGLVEPRLLEQIVPVGRGRRDGALLQLRRHGLEGEQSPFGVERHGDHAGDEGRRVVGRHARVGARL